MGYIILDVHAFEVEYPGDHFGKRVDCLFFCLGPESGEILTDQFPGEFLLQVIYFLHRSCVYTPVRMVDESKEVILTSYLNRRVIIGYVTRLLMILPESLIKKPAIWRAFL